ncbi:hypothetical protein JFT80_17980 [Pseudomonas sp. TH10]|nr:hypothetical protein [Pseudomonas sp. TH10]MBK5518936.1 hypothetical protein [Pseudomonas sp. TH10]
MGLHAVAEHEFPEALGLPVDGAQLQFQRAQAAPGRAQGQLTALLAMVTEAQQSADFNQ